MGCGYSWERGHAGFNYPTEYKVGDRVALNVERRKPSERFPGTFCTKAEVDVGTVASATPKMVVRHPGAAEGGAGAKGAPMFYHVEYHIKFAHGGAIRVDSVEKRLWVPSEEDEASARAVLARLSGDAAAGDDPSAAGSAPVWEFEDGPSGSGAWRRFDADGAAQAESARGGQFCFGRGSGTYFVDTGAMTQTNVETSVSRRIRRRLA